MKHIGKDLQKSLQKTRETERGELMKYFVEHLNPSRVRDGLAPLSMGRMGKLLEKIPTKDLYYLQRVCDDSPNFSKKFWWEINPKNHTEEAKKESAARFAKMDASKRMKH
jgi:hypothetical protein